MFGHRLTVQVKSRSPGGNALTRGREVGTSARRGPGDRPTILTQTHGRSQKGARKGAGRKLGILKHAARRCKRRGSQKMPAAVVAPTIVVAKSHRWILMLPTLGAGAALQIDEYL